MTFYDCINNGNITGSADNVGGFVGYIERNINIALTMAMLLGVIGSLEGFLGFSITAMM